MAEMKGSERSLQGSTSADWICDSCVHYPPSSFDGKPCALCNPDDPMLNCYQKREEPITTNADRIRAMSDEELAEFQANIGYCPPIHNRGYHCKRHKHESCSACWLDWLKQEVEQDEP